MSNSIVVLVVQTKCRLTGYFIIDLLPVNEYKQNYMVADHVCVTHIQYTIALGLMRECATMRYEVQNIHTTNKTKRNPCKPKKNYFLCHTQLCWPKSDVVHKGKLNDSELV